MQNNRLAQEGAEIIQEQTCQPATGSTIVVTESSQHTSLAFSSNPSKKCQLSAWLKEAAEAQAPSNSPFRDKYNGRSSDKIRTKTPNV